MEMRLLNNSNIQHLQNYGLQTTSMCINSHGEVTPLSSRTPRARQKKSVFFKLHHKIGSKFYQFYFMSRYTRNVLDTKNS